MSNVRHTHPGYYGVLLVLYAAAIHLLAGASLLLRGQQLQTSTLSPLYPYLHDYRLVAATLILAAVCAIYGLRRVSVLYYLPQLLIVLTQALIALSLAMRGHYGDGVPRNFFFIFVDQLPAIMLAPFYVWSILHLWQRG